MKFTLILSFSVFLPKTLLKSSGTTHFCLLLINSLLYIWSSVVYAEEHLILGVSAYVFNSLSYFLKFLLKLLFILFSWFIFIIEIFCLYFASLNKSVPIFNTSTLKWSSLTYENNIFKTDSGSCFVLIIFFGVNICFFNEFDFCFWNLKSKLGLNCLGT